MTKKYSIYTHEFQRHYLSIAKKNLMRNIGMNVHSYTWSTFQDEHILFSQPVMMIGEEECCIAFWTKR
jgi:hypothetical protein